MAVNLDACIQCTRCVRACREEQVNDVIGYAYRGEGAKIVFDMDDPMGASTCVACGECVQACPTGALMPAARRRASRCPTSRSSRCARSAASAASSPTTSRTTASSSSTAATARPTTARLCVKGRYGFDYAHHPHRLTKPLIRRAGRAEARRLRRMDPRARHGRVPRGDLGRGARPSPAARLRKHPRRSTARKSLAGFGSAKGSNEEAYLFQKLVRTGFGTNNVDHCTRLCHASSVAALLEGIGSGAVSNPVMDVMQAEVVLLIGANPTVNHPVAATWIKNAVEARHQADRLPIRAAPSWPATRTATCSSSPTPTSRCSTR